MWAKDLNRYLGDVGWRRSPIPPEQTPSPPSKPATGGESLDDLAATAAGCTLCRLCEQRRTVVFGEGDPKAGVMFVGISNKISKSGTTDIPNEEYLVHARRHPWDAWQDFLERSPIYHAQRGRTPLLILHGEDDPRVSVTQSKELHRALKTMGKTPVRLVLYPGEGHGNRKGAARYDLMLRSLRWFDHYLTGPAGDPPPHTVDYRSPEHGWDGQAEDTAPEDAPGEDGEL